MGEFEKDIRDMFADYELHIDSDEIWPGIEKKLNKNKRKKRFLWWWFTPLLLLLPLGFFLTGNKLEKNQSVKNSQELGSADTTENSNNSISLKTDTDFDNNNANYRTDLNDSERNENQTTARKPNTKKSPAINMQDQIIKIAPEKIAWIATEKIKKDISDSNNPSIEINLNQSIQKAFYITDLLKTLIRPFNYERNLVLRIKNTPKTLEKKIITKKWDKSMDFALGFALVNKFLNAKETSFNQYKEKRLATESHLEALTAGAKFQVKHKSGIFINTGLSYSQIDEKFSSFDSVDILKTGEGIINILTKPDGTQIEERGKKDVIEHRTWDKTIYNYYFFFDLPVNIGYAGKIKNVNYEISSGVAYNLGFMKKGQILGIYNYPVSINKENGIYKTRSGFSFNSGIKLLIPYKNHQFFIEPKFKYNLQSLTTDEYPLSQKYLTYGIEIGGRIKL